MKFLSKNLSKIKGKTVLLRLDLNEPVDDRGRLLDDFRLKTAIPTIEELLRENCKIIIVAHLGRPDGKKVQKFSLSAVADRLAELLNLKFVESDSALPDYPVPHFIFFKGDITKSENQSRLTDCHSRNVILLENIRYYEAEEKNQVTFAKHLASLAEVYINDAFAVSHRKGSSIVAITKYLPSYAGLLLEKEIEHLSRLMGGKNKKPFVLVMGGIKISDKAKTLAHLGKQADAILIGGGLANLFLVAQGMEVGNSVFEEENIPIAKQILINFKHKLVLPKDVITTSGRTTGKTMKRRNYQVNSTDSIFDIGPETILEFSQILKTAGTICWNGPMGYFEKKPFHTGTFTLARTIGSVGTRKAYVVAGGGETVAAIREAKQFDYFDHVSTGGGAMLEYLSGDKLPGIEALK